MNRKTKKYGMVALLGVLIVGIVLISGCIVGGPSEEESNKTQSGEVQEDVGVKKMSKPESISEVELQKIPEDENNETKKIGEPRRETESTAKLECYYNKKLNKCTGS